MNNGYKLDLNYLAGTIEHGRGMYRHGSVPLHKQEAIFLWNALQDRCDEHATNLKRKLMKYTVHRHLFYIRKEEVPYLLSIIQGAKSDTHRAFNDYITCCGIDLLAVPAGQFVGQKEEPSCAGCRSAADPPCETGTDTRGQSKAGRKNKNETTEEKAGTPAPPAAPPLTNPYHELARFLQEGGSEAYEKVLRAVNEISEEKQREESQQ